MADPAISTSGKDDEEEDEIMGIDIDLQGSSPRPSASALSPDDTETTGEQHNGEVDVNCSRTPDITAVFSGALSRSPSESSRQLQAHNSSVDDEILCHVLESPALSTTSSVDSDTSDTAQRSCRPTHHDGAKLGGEELDHFYSDPDHVWQSIRRKAGGGPPSTSSSSLKLDDGTRRTEATAVEVKRLSVLAVKSAARHCRRSFAHYDGASALTNLTDSYGLSGASAVNSSGEEEAGDLRGNELVLAAPQFWNELGGDLHKRSNLKKDGAVPLVFTPASSTGVVLEVSLCHTKGDENERKRRRFCQLPLWRPSGGHQTVLETQVHFNSYDLGALYYRYYFSECDHLNLFGVDDELGPIAISLRRETVELNSVNRFSATDLLLSSQDALADSGMVRAPGGVRHQYRVIVRTARPYCLRGTVSEDSIVAAGAQLRPTPNNPGLSIRDVLSFVAPEVQMSCLKVGLTTEKVVSTLLKLDEQGLCAQYKVGVVYCKANQSTEEQMYNNEEGSPLFYEFMDCIADKVTLKGFTNYRGQLDNKNDSTGLFSYYASFEGMEVMFHVSTLLPYTPNHQQQLLRKRHIGNDIVTIIFQEKDALPFTPTIIRSQFQHVFIVVRAAGKCPTTGKSRFAVAVSQAKDTPPFGPPLPADPIFVIGSEFRRFLLTKLINAECAAHHCQKFFSMSTRTRREYLSSLAKDSSSTQSLEGGGSGSLLSRIRRQLTTDKSRSTNMPMATTVDLLHLPGAMVWPVIVTNWGLGKEEQGVECLLALSHAGVVFLDPEQRTVRCNIPPDYVAGWSSVGNVICIFYRSNAHITFSLNCGPVLSDEAVAEVLVRLSACSKGCAATELTLHKGDMADYGFVVHNDGVVSEVNEDMPGFKAGVRCGSRIVDMDGVSVYGQPMTEVVTHLREAFVIKALVVPPNPDGTPRGGRFSTSLDAEYVTQNEEERKRTPPPVLPKPERRTPPASPESAGRVVLRKKLNERWMQEVLSSASAPPKPRNRLGSVDSPSLRGVVRKAKDRLAARSSSSQGSSPMVTKRTPSTTVVSGLRE